MEMQIKILRLADVNGDGILSMDEFKAFHRTLDDISKKLCDAAAFMEKIHEHAPEDPHCDHDCEEVNVDLNEWIHFFTEPQSEDEPSEFASRPHIVNSHSEEILHEEESVDTKYSVLRSRSETHEASTKKGLSRKNVSQVSVQSLDSEVVPRGNRRGAVDKSGESEPRPDLFMKQRSNPMRSTITKQLKTSKLTKYRGIGTAVSVINDTFAPAYAKFTKKSYIEAEREIYNWLTQDSQKKKDEAQKALLQRLKKDTYSIGDVEVVRYLPNTLTESDHNEPYPTIFFYHGGGFTSNTIEAYSSVLGELALRVNAQVISPEYRLAPESPYPACREDVFNTTHSILSNPDQFNVNIYNYALVGDSAGADLAIWTSIQLSNERQRDIEDGASEEALIPRAKMLCPIYPCVQSFIYDYFPSLRAKKANKFLRQSFFTSRMLYLLGFDGNDAEYQKVISKNYHLTNAIKMDTEILETCAPRYLIDRVGDVEIGTEVQFPIPMSQDKIDKSPLIQKVQQRFSEFIDDALVTKPRIEILKDYGPEKWFVVAAENDHARDGAIVLANRLKSYGPDCELLVVPKAFHGFFTSSVMLGGFEQKDDQDVMTILKRISDALDTVSSI